MFGPEKSYIQQIETGDRTYIDDDGKGYRVKVWVPTGFTRQG